MKRILLISLFVFNTTPSARADSAVAQDPVDNISDIQLHWEKIPTSFETIQKLQQSSLNFVDLNHDRAAIDWNTIVNIGKKLWPIITDNAPVATLDYDYATGLPQGVTNVSDLENFSDLQYETWRFHATNPFGSILYDVEYTLVHQYGGSYQGNGAYLATVAILPTKVDITWGHKLNMKVAAVSSVNVGTAQDPIASVTLEMSYEIKAFMRTIAVRKLFQFRGDSPEIIATTL